MQIKIFFSAIKTKLNDSNIPPIWGFPEKDGVLISMTDGMSLLEYIEEDYNAFYGEDTIDEFYEPSAPTYDLSKASGILAFMEMTE